jgi:hypothetical protein
MSALGQKQTFAMQNGMSALPPKADINRFRDGNSQEDFFVTLALTKSSDT